MSYETILTERVGNVLKITLNRPERLNAASIPLAGEAVTGPRRTAVALVTSQGIRW